MHSRTIDEQIHHLLSQKMSLVRLASLLGASEYISYHKRKKVTRLDVEAFRKYLEQQEHIVLPENYVFTGNTILPPDTLDMPHTGTDTPSSDKSIITRAQYVMELLGTLKGVSYDLYDGHNDPSMMRTLSYVGFAIQSTTDPSLKKLILVCDEGGNATFVVHTIEYSIDTYLNMKKSELKTLIQDEKVNRIVWSFTNGEEYKETLSAVLMHGWVEQQSMQTTARTQTMHHTESRQKTMISDIPLLLAEYSPRNMLPASSVVAGTHKKLWWICSKEGCGYEWGVAGKNRVNGNGCPACAHQVATSKNNLAVTHPDLVKEYSSRNPLPAELVLAGTSKKLWWKCSREECSYEWEAKGCHRVNGRGCPACVNYVATPKNNLTVTHPDLVKEYSSRNPLPAERVIASTGKKLWWICSKEGCGYEWEASGNSRVYGSGCPACAHQVATPKNNLTVTYPDLVKEYSSRNPLLAEQVIAGTNKKLWWKCSKEECGYEWEATGNKRVNGSGCPACARRRRSSSKE